MKKTFKTTKAYVVVEKIGDVFHVDLYYYEDGKIEEKTFKNEADLTKFMATLGQIEKAREIKTDPSMNQRPGPQNRKKANKGRKNKADESKTAMVEAGKQRVPLTAKAFALQISSHVETKTFPGKVQKEGEEYVIHFNYGMSFQVFPGIACTATVAIRPSEKDVMIAGSIRGDFDEAWAKKGQVLFYKNVRAKAEELGFKAQPPADAMKGEVDFKGFYDLKGKVAGEDAFVIKKRDIQAITSFINESFNCWLVESANKAKKQKGAIKYEYKYPGGSFYAMEIYAESIDAAKEQLRKEWNVKKLPSGFEIWPASGNKSDVDNCRKIKDLLDQLKRVGISESKIEEIEAKLGILIDPGDYALESIQEILYDPDGEEARKQIAEECGLSKISFNFARQPSMRTIVRREWIEHRLEEDGCDPVKLADDLRFAEENIKANEEWAENIEKEDEPEINKKQFRKIAKSNILQMTRLKKAIIARQKECKATEKPKRASKRGYFYLEVRPVGEKTTEQGYLDWYWFVPIAKRAINPETGRMARRYKISKPGKGSQFVTFDVGSREERQIPGVQGLGYTVGLSKKILNGLNPGDVVFGSKLRIQKIMIERDVLKLDAGYTTDDLEAVIEKIYGEWLLKDLSKDLGKDFTSFKVIAKGTDYVISFK